MYDSILMAHNLFRWIVVLVGLRLLFLIFKEGEENRKSIAYFLWSFNQVFNYQVAVGLILYVWLSPFPKMGFTHPELLHENRVIRFWTLLHGPSMIVGLVIFSLGRAKYKKAEEKKKLPILRVTMVITMLIILLAIPWPFLEYGRPLYRFFDF